MTNTTLLPCPFCGAPAELIHNSHWDYFVRCTDKRCAARTRQYHENETAAVMRWNARAERTCTVEGVSNNCVYAEMLAYALSCGHEIEWDDEEPPAYCPECGAKVVSE